MRYGSTSTPAAPTGPEGSPALLVLARAKVPRVHMKLLPPAAA